MPLSAIGAHRAPPPLFERDCAEIVQVAMKVAAYVAFAASGFLFNPIVGTCTSLFSLLVFSRICDSAGHIPRPQRHVHHTRHQQRSFTPIEVPHSPPVWGVPVHHIGGASPQGFPAAPNSGGATGSHVMPGRRTASPPPPPPPPCVVETRSSQGFTAPIRHVGGNDGTHAMPGRRTSSPLWPPAAPLPLFRTTQPLSPAFSPPPTRVAPFGGHHGGSVDAGTHAMPGRRAAPRLSPLSEHRDRVSDGGGGGCGGCGGGDHVRPGIRR